MNSNKKTDMLKQTNLQMPPLITQQQQRIEKKKQKNMMDAIAKNIETQMNDLKEVVKENAMKAEEAAKKSEELKRKSDDRLFNLLENLLSNKEKPNAMEVMEDSNMNPDVMNKNEDQSTSVTNEEQVGDNSNENSADIEKVSTSMTGLQLDLKKLEVKDLPSETSFEDSEVDSDENGTTIIDVDQIINENKILNKKVKHLEKCVTELNIRNNEAVKYILTVEKKLDDLIKNKKEDVKKNDETAENNVEDPSKPDNDDTNFPPLRKSFSTKVNKSKGKVIQSDPSLFTNPNMKQAKVVSTKNRRRRPNYREVLERNIEEEVSKIDKSKIEMKNTNEITMDKKDDLKEALMNDMKRTFGVETNNERQVDKTIKALENEKKIDAKLSYKVKESIAMKVIVENFILNEAKIDKEEWESMFIDKFHIGTKKKKDNSRVQVIYCRMANPKDTNIIRSKMAEMDKETSSKLVNYVHQSAFQRWKIFDTMAWQYRKEGKSAKIWHGKSDFLLLVKEKNDTQKWSDLAPRFVPEHLLVDFDIGKLNKEDEEYYNVLQKDRYDENVAKNEVLKEQITNDENRVDKEYKTFEEKQYPCSDHLEPACEICYYDDEQMAEHGQNTQNDPLAPSVENDSEPSPSDETIHDVSIESV